MNFIRRLWDRLAVGIPLVPLQCPQERSRTVNLLTELDRIGCAPTPENPVLYRGLGESGALLFLHLPRGLSLKILDRLAECTDRTALLNELLSFRRSGT